MNIELVKANETDAEKIWNMQKVAFAELLERYQDFETNPASEPLEKTVMRLNQPYTYFYFIVLNGVKIGAIRVVDRKTIGEPKKISSLFIMTQYRGRGYAQAAIKSVEAIHGESGWVLDTIEQEEGNCRLYEKTGYLKTDKRTYVNDKMTLIFYKK